MLPNLITISRIIMTFFMVWLLESDQYSMFMFLSINILIFITDIIDGKIARHFNLVSQVGEILDVSADLIYILSIYTVMSLKNTVSFYYLFIVIGEFIVFIITSKYINQDKKYLVFDTLGRILAVLYYISPSIMFVTFVKNRALYNLLYKYGFYIVCALTFIVIVHRINLCFKNTELDFSETNQIFENEL